VIRALALIFFEIEVKLIWQLQRSLSAGKPDRICPETRDWLGRRSRRETMNIPTMIMGMRKRPSMSKTDRNGNRRGMVEADIPEAETLPIMTLSSPRTFLDT
jgi:hypothetical protein